MAYFSGDTGLRALVGVFLLSCIFLTTTYHTTFAFDRPVCTAVLACSIAGSAFLALAMFIDHIPQCAPSPKSSIIPLTERCEPLLEELSLTRTGQVNDFLRGRIRKLSRLKRVHLIWVIGCIRVEFYRQIAYNTECASTGYTYAIPFLVSLYDYWRNQRRPAIEESATADSALHGKSQILATLYRRVYFSFCRCRLRYVISAAFLLAGGLVTSRFHDGKESTYICPIISGLAPRLQLFKLLNVVLDTLILIGAAEISRDARSQDARKQTLVSWGYGLLGVAMFWAVPGIIIAKNIGIGDNGFFDTHYFRSAFAQSMLVASLLLSASQILWYYGIVGLSLLAGFVSIYFTWASALFNGREPFPLISASDAIVALVAIVTGGILFLCSRAASEDEPKFLWGMNVFVRLTVLFLFGVGLIFAYSQPGLTSLHAIDLLIHQGRLRHDRWFSQVAGSGSLRTAASAYRMRYDQYPPPGFDKWYEYATSRGSVIIDDFDQIHNDLLPFRAIPPKQLREMTHQIATNPFNDIGVITIRNGTPHVQEGIKPTHAWMVSGAAKMIKKFSEHLPDMDIAFNLNDEPRVAVPWEKVSALRDQARAQPAPEENRVIDGWSHDRALGWGPVEPAHQTNETLFTDAAWSNIFDRYVSAVCPPSSEARSQRIWDRDSICISCIRPHSIGQFPVDWSVATDICHQPDLESLHGFILSPASFKVSQDLVPLFSQSTVSGFSDVLYPSPWNYVDKVKYEPSPQYPDPEYGQKANSLFWIGSTSEGVSTHGQWRGMARQRFSHFVNNNTLNKVSVLLPTGGNGTYSYQIMDGTAPSEQLGLDATVHLSDPIVRCGDCREQKKEMFTAGWIPFQTHWSHRYLFDLDGAGFSGRFIPFLQSHSLPFKSGLLRQWLDSRVTAWRHFVPVDLRLHGMWSTLAYFAGVDANLGSAGEGRRVLMEPHDAQGEWIAEEGRKWAEKTLRKEDMEIYFFRLLLEWGRLTDDLRDLLGYKP